MQRSRNRRRRHRQHIDIHSNLFQFFFMLNTKPLLLIDDQQSQILKPNIAAQKPVRTDQNIDIADLCPLNNFRRLLFRLETINRFHRNRKIRKPLRKRPLVLHAKHRRRHKHRDLLARLNRLERRPHRKFRLAIPDIPAKQPVHRRWLLHIRLNVCANRLLIRRRLIRKRFFKFTLPVRIRPISNARHTLPLGLHFQKFRRQIINRLRSFFLRPLPFFRTDRT